MVFTAYPFRDYVIFKLPFVWKTSLYASFCVDKGADNQKLPALFVFCGRLSFQQKAGITCSRAAARTMLSSGAGVRASRGPRSESWLGAQFVFILLFFISAAGPLSESFINFVAY